jgi:hypothetical protein
VHLDIIRVFYLPTDPQESCFKNIKICIKTALKYFGLITIIRASVSILFELAKVIVVKIIN